MIISDKYRYVFVELPLTGTTAISKELRESYDGRPILNKHSPYHRFLEVADTGQRQYFVFSGIRNPLDETVSEYFKKKTDHHQRYSDPTKWKRNSGDVSEWSLKRYRFIRDENADFPKFLKKFYTRPYDNWSNLNHKKFDYIIRFERIRDDFARVISMLGLELVRPLPVVHQTGERNKDFACYYSANVIGHAARIFGPFMKEWGYEMPAEWAPVSVPLRSHVEFRLLRVARQIHWRRSLFE